MMRIFLIFMVILGLSALPVYAQQSEGIAVVVNDEAISFSDLEDRMQLVMASSNLPNTDEMRERVLPQVLNSLIEERIKLQEANSLEIAVTEDEVDGGLLALAQQNKMTSEEFTGMLERSRLNVETLRQQLRAQIAWSKLIQARLRGQIVISENDVDTRMEQLRASIGAEQYLVAEVFLPVEQPDEDANVKRLADRLVGQLTSGQAPFTRIARQFSKAAGAPQGGDMGWVQAEQLPEQLGAVIGKIGKSEISPPIRSLSGYHILFVRDKRVIAEENMPSREEIGNQLGLERLDRAQRRHYIDLKSAAFIESRV